MSISFPVTAGHMSAAAPISLANSTFIQGVGGKENAIASNGLKNAQIEYRGSGKCHTHYNFLNATNNIFAIMFNNLTFSRHANPSEISVFAGCSIPSLNH